MSCCGDRRAAWRQPGPPVAAAVTRPPAALQDPVGLSFTGTGPIAVRGTATGLTYAFPAGSLALNVDARDAPALLRTGRFTQAHPVAPCALDAGRTRH
jgi:hypothetical protein